MKIKLLGLCFLLSGCMMGPNYQPPDPCIPETWMECDPCLAQEVPVAWWQEFNDPLLDCYIKRAACYNNDVLVAAATIFQARAMRTVAASELFPQVNGDLFATRTYFSKNGPLFNITGGAVDTPGLPFQIQVPQIQNIYTALIDVSWELDLFGRIRRGVEAADATIGSAIEQRNGVLTAVFAEVARNYVDLRSAQQRGVLVEQNISLLEDEAALVRKRWEKGLLDRLEVENVEAQVAELKATLPPICAQIYQNIYAISVLTGALPETLLEELSPIGPLPEPPANITCGLRTDLLRRRPDIREAERNLAAATANIGVAVASFFPSLSLIGDIGLQSLDFRRLFQMRSNTWSIGGLSTIPIFQGGNLVGNLRLSEGEAAAAGFTYQQTVLTALKETESALIAYTQDTASTFHLQQAVERYSVLDSLTTDQYEKGLVSLTNVIESERQLTAAQENLLGSETTVLQDIITLYQALGGGWELY